MHPKLSLICRILDKPEISKLTNGEYRTNVNLNTNGGLHHLEIISGSSWAENIELKKIFQLELDVTMTNDHILIFQNPIWKYLRGNHESARIQRITKCAKLNYFSR